MFKDENGKFNVSLFISEDETYQILVDKIPLINETICMINITDNLNDIRIPYKIIDIVHFINGQNNKDDDLIVETTILVLKKILEIDNYNEYRDLY